MVDDQRSRSLTYADVATVVPLEQIIAAVAYCRIGGARPSDDRAFTEAKARGLLAQDSTWRATERGEGALIAAGRLKGTPAPERLGIRILWARSERYQRPQFVTAWSDGLAESWDELYRDQRAEAERFFADFGDGGPWTFWTTEEYLDAPPAPEHDDEEEADRG